MAQLLDQQELLEPPPRRRIIVPDGRTAWWGVDPSTLRVAVAGVSRAFDGSLARWVRLQPFAGLEGPARLSEVYSGTRAFVAGLAACCPWPGIVWVEQPSGKMENPALSYAVGVTLAAVYDGLLDVCGSPVRVETIPSPTWKKLATGYGAHYKPTRKKLGRTPVFEDYAVARWARANGYAGSSWDEADAWGVAEAARREVALDAR